MSRTANVTVTARECRNNNERMIRKFSKKVKKERIIEQVKDRRRYKKPSVVKKEKTPARCEKQTERAIKKTKSARKTQ